MTTNLIAAKAMTYPSGLKVILLAFIAGALLTPLAISQERSSRPFTADSLRAAADYLQGLNGHAMLVYHRHQLVFEEYFNG